MSALFRFFRIPTKIIPSEYCLQVNNYAIPGNNDRTKKQASF